MTHGTEEHLEHAHHAQHAAHDPFNQRVAMTMAIVAAVLAAITLLSHRAHTETLRLQGEATRLQTEASILHTRSTDKWNEFQANNIRNHEYQAYLELFPVLAKAPNTQKDQTHLQKDWSGKVATYKVKLPPLQDEAQELGHQGEELQKEAGEKLQESDHTHHQADRFDLGELGVELALVLCSIAVLTKGPGFWYSGILIGLLGLGVGVSGFFLH